MNICEHSKVTPTAAPAPSPPLSTSVLLPPPFHLSSLYLPPPSSFYFLLYLAAALPQDVCTSQHPPPVSAGFVATPPHIEPFMPRQADTRVVEGSTSETSWDSLATRAVTTE